jgi:hypothetical protein
MRELRREDWLRDFVFAPMRLVACHSLLENHRAIENDIARHSK